MVAIGSNSSQSLKAPVSSNSIEDDEDADEETGHTYVHNSARSGQKVRENINIKLSAIWDM